MTTTPQPLANPAPPTGHMQVPQSVAIGALSNLSFNPVKQQGHLNRPHVSEKESEVMFDGMPVTTVRHHFFYCNVPIEEPDKNGGMKVTRTVRHLAVKTTIIGDPLNAPCQLLTEQQAAELAPREWAAFCNGLNTDVEDGTPITELPNATMQVVSYLMGLNVRTIEDCAALPEDVLRGVAPEIRTFHHMAVDFLQRRRKGSKTLLTASTVAEAEVARDEALAKAEELEEKVRAQEEAIKMLRQSAGGVQPAGAFAGMGDPSQAMPKDLMGIDYSGGDNPFAEGDGVFTPDPRPEAT